MEKKHNVCHEKTRKIFCVNILKIKIERDKNDDKVP